MEISSPSRQKLETCRIEGPDRPRCVNSKASRNEVLPWLTTASTEAPASAFGLHLRAQLPRGRCRHIVGQHVDDLLRRPVAKQLPERFLVVGDAPRINPLDEIPCRKALQRRNAEMRVLRQELFRAGMHIGEIAPPAAGYANLFTGLFGMINDQHAASALASLGSGKHARRARADDDDVEGFGVHAAFAPRTW